MNGIDVELVLSAYHQQDSKLNHTLSIEKTERVCFIVYKRAGVFYCL